MQHIEEALADIVAQWGPFDKWEFTIEHNHIEIPVTVDGFVYVGHFYGEQPDGDVQHLGLWRMPNGEITCS
jgi:hypothetical protein